MMKPSLKLSLLCVGIFASGAVAGGFGGRKFFPPPSLARASAPGGGGAQESFGAQQLRRFTAELELTDAQREALRPIMEQAGEDLRRLRRESWRQSSTIIDRMEAAVALRLNPQQRERFAVLQESQRARLKARMEERHRRRSEGESPGPSAPDDSR